MNWRYVIPVLALGCATQASTRSEGPSAASRFCANTPSQDTTVYDTTQVTTKPQVRVGPRLEYPKELRQNGISGSVVYSVVVNADGRVDRRSIKLLRSDNVEFDRAAREYLEQAFFLPGCLHGEAVRVRVILPIDFRILR